MHYFAYGSNMLTTRLTARTPGARVLGTARVTGRRLAFQKRSVDGSSKCDIPLSTDPDSIVHGVLFEIPEDQIDELDRHEGVGYGYAREMMEVLRGEKTIRAAVYVATPDHIDADLLPYEWYHHLVVAGAREHSLPEAYVQTIDATPSREDPEPGREGRLAALQALLDAAAPQV